MSTELERFFQEFSLSAATTRSHLWFEMCGRRRTELGQGAHGRSHLPRRLSCHPWTSGAKCRQACLRLPSSVAISVHLSGLGSRPWSTFRSEGPSSDPFPPCTLPRGRKDREPRPRSATRTVPRRKKGYCECCQQAFEELHGVSPFPKQLLPRLF